MTEEREDTESGEGNKLSIMKKKDRKEKKKKLSYYFIPRFPCMRMDDDDVAAAETPAAGGGFDIEAVCNGRDHSPTHLVVMVNGIIGRYKVAILIFKHFFVFNFFLFFGFRLCCLIFMWLQCSRLEICCQEVHEGVSK